jgi:hypothetical protein
MSESKKQDTLDLEEKLASLHPRFLEILRQVYPLAVLGSLCIAISAFAHQSYPDAQAFALASASLFLTAFVLSFLFEIFKKIPILALMSYTSTALAVFLLFIAILEFGVTTPMIFRTFSTALGLVGIIFVFSMYYPMVKVVAKTESKLARVIAWLSISCGILFGGVAILGLLYGFFSGENIYIKIDFFRSLVLSSLIASFVFAFIFIFFARKELKRKKSEVP